MSETRTVATFTAIIAVTQGQDALLIDWPRVPADLIEEMAYYHAVDAGFVDVPTDTGVWRCTCQETTNRYDERTYAVTASEKLLDLGTCTTTYEEDDEVEEVADVS